MAKRPWNLLNLPVYSISSYDGVSKYNMHIITYATAISMHPKRFVCGIFKGTATLENVEANPHFVLQILSEHQYNLIPLLGKKSGHTIDKIAKLEKQSLLTEWNEFKVLKEAVALMKLSILRTIDNTGDHIIFLCSVDKYCIQNNHAPLYLDVLREHKLIRI